METMVSYMDSPFKLQGKLPYSLASEATATLRQIAAPGNLKQVAQKPKPQQLRNTSEKEWMRMANKIDINHSSQNVALNQRVSNSAAVSSLSPVSIQAVMNRLLGAQLKKTMREAGVSSKMDTSIQLSVFEGYFEAMLKEDKYMHHLITSINKTDADLPDQPKKSKTGTTKSTELIAVNFEQLTTEELRELTANSKQQSILLQVFADSSDKVSPALVKGIVQDLEFMVYHKQANYVVQKLLKKDSTFLQRVTEFSMANFEALCLNEYSSRVLQSLTELNPEFLKFAANYFSQHLDFWQNKISSIFVLLSVIRHASSLQDCAFVKSILLADKAALFSSKYLKRVLVTYVEKCSIKEMEEICEHLQLNEEIPAILEDKFFVYVYHLLVRKGRRHTLKSILKAIQQETSEALRARHFKFLLVKLAMLPDRSVRRQLFKSLASIQEEQVQKLFSRPQDMYFLSYLIIKIGNSLVRSRKSSLMASPATWSGQSPYTVVQPLSSTPFLTKAEWNAPTCTSYANMDSISKTFRSIKNKRLYSNFN